MKISPIQIEALKRTEVEKALMVKIMGDLVKMHQELLKKAEELEVLAEKVNKKEGPMGPKPQKGVDYYTAKELAEVIEYLEDKIDDLKKPDEKKVSELVLSKIKQPKDGSTPIKGKDYFTKEDKEELIEKLISRLPKEKEEEDIFDKIEKHPTRKLTTKHIDGLEQTLSAFDLQLRSKGGYLHGGGVPSLVAGTGVTLTKTSDGGYIITSTGGGTGTNSLTEKVTGVQSGTDVTLDLTTLAHTPSVILFVTRQGQILTPTDDWTQTGDIITVGNADASEIFLVTYTYI